MITRAFIRANAPKSGVFTAEHFKVDDVRKLKQTIQSMIQRGMVIRLERNLFRMVPKDERETGLTAVLLEVMPWDRSFTSVDLQGMVDGEGYTRKFVQATLRYLERKGAVTQVGREQGVRGTYRIVYARIRDDDEPPAAPEPVAADAPVITPENLFLYNSYRRAEHAVKRRIAEVKG